MKVKYIRSFRNKTGIFFRSHPKKILFVTISAIFYYFCLPQTLFKAPTATVIESAEGTLLGAKIASDGQWRFPEIDSVPYKFQQCILLFEDEYFYQHPGFNPVAMAKALASNLRKRKTVRGGSTLTQQVVRLWRQEKKRSYLEKAVELLLATRLEWRYTKDEILKLYASHAPFGGNVVGLEMAAWRYFGLQPHQLSWAEAATLAVLPNAPSLIYPGKNQSKLEAKRNRLLKKIHQHHLIDQTTYELALLEALPQKPFSVPQNAPHLLTYGSKKWQGQRLRTNINAQLQGQVNGLVEKHYKNLKQNQVHNAAVLVMDVHTRAVLSYVGNTPTDKEHEKDVDMVQANRSTGSVLKPLLYTAMLDAGELLPDMLVPDVPTQIGGYTPENFNETYSGAVKAKVALARSLNIPAVRLLQSYGVKKFRDQLDFFNLRGINKAADHYGLTLILGGAETNLWDLCKTYAALASTLNHYTSTSGTYYSNEVVAPQLSKNTSVHFGQQSPQKSFFDAGSIYLTFDAMKEVNRPDGNESWAFYDSSKEIAWKTGTSFGNKDAWTIGLTKDFVVGVWVGNADGEGRPDLTGVSSAAPILFDVFDVLPPSAWFTKPLDEFAPITVCTQSGFLASEACPGKTIDIPNKRNGIAVCSYHQWVHLDANRLFRVHASCEALSQMVTTSWFVLPPLQEFYYKKAHPEYQNVPPLRADCLGAEESGMAFIYPKDKSRISLSKNFEGTYNELILKVAHRRSDTKVFWYLDDRFIGETLHFHELGVLPDPGNHRITAVDAYGNEVAIEITID
nr:penicillin-binding protein 1C [Arenibacter sp. GZD-96]